MIEGFLAANSGFLEDSFGCVKTLDSIWNQISLFLSVVNAL